MKKLSKIFIVFITLICVTVGGLRNVQAEKYKYRVTVLAGLHGTITYKGETGLDKVDVYLEAGELWNPNDFEVVPFSREGEPEYHFLRFQVSGIEAREGTLAAVPVNEDMVFVATYGVEGKLIEYQVKYVDENDKELHKPSTFHGNPGDYPVVAFQYIEGYLPQAYNLEGLKLEEGKENTFTFEYKKVEEPAAETAVNNSGSGNNSTSAPALVMNVNGENTSAETKPEEKTPETAAPAETISKPAEENKTLAANKLGWAPYAFGGVAVLGSGAGVYLAAKRKQDLM